MRRLLFTVPLLLVPLLLELAAEMVRLVLVVDSVRVTVALPVRTDPNVLVDVTRGSVRVVVVVTLLPELVLPAPVRVVVVTVLPLGRVRPLVMVPFPGLVKPPLLVLVVTAVVPVRLLNVRPVVVTLGFLSSNLPSKRLVLLCLYSPR